MRAYHVEIKQVSLGWDKQGVFVISDNGQYFEKPDETFRTFVNPSGAIAFLKRACKKYPNLNYVVTMPDGKEKVIGEIELDENKFGPHEWSKKNSMTIIENGGSYDIYICRFCHKEEKAYGLSGHSIRSGTCKNNPIE